MESNREVFLRMTEEYYLSIPDETRECYLRDKRIDKENGDWLENMKDSVFRYHYNTIKSNKTQLEERQYFLREERRKVTYYKGFRIYPDNTGYVKFNFHLIDAELMAGYGESIEDCKDQIDELVNN